MTAPDDRPRDRPPLSQPIGGGFAMAWLYLFWGGTFALTGMAVIGLMVPVADQTGFGFVGLLAAIAVPLGFVILGARVGKRWAFRLMRALALVGACVLATDIAVGLLASMGRMRVGDFPAGSFSAEDTGHFVLFASALVAVPGFLLIRAFRRVRWLDPNSRPSEWEKPMRSAARIRTGRW